MSELEKNRATEQLARQEKKPYQKPAFEYEQVFETMALTCGKLTGGCGEPGAPQGAKVS
ncbi:MAG: hypothetical protein Q8N47_01280 [Bryobacterales bacterium]|nr:hypothetical protein [Bryobacterales bacterium]